MAVTPMAMSAADAAVAATPGAGAAHGTSAAGVLRVEHQVSDEVWDAYVAAHPAATPYHRSGWTRLVARAFGHEARLLAAERGGTITGVLPLVVMRSRLFGRFVVSVPFLNAGGLVADDEASANAVLDAACRITRDAGAAYLELRHTARRFPALAERRHKVAMTLRLCDTADAQWTALDRKVRNQIRKGEKSGLRSADGGVDLVGDFYRVFARNMRDLGTPVFGIRLFEEALRTFPENCRVFLVRHGDRPVAGSIVHWRGDMLEVIWASALREANALCANPFLYWQTIRFAIARGCRRFEFGRCTPGEGPYHFKRQWGAEPSELVWEYWMPDSGAPRREFSAKSGGFGRAAAIWRHLPVPLATFVGPRIVRGIPC